MRSFISGGEEKSSRMKVATARKIYTVVSRPSPPPIPYLHGMLSQDHQWLPDTAGSTEPYTYTMFFLYVHTCDKV